MLQSMRSAAKYVWIIIVITFVGGFLLVETSGLLGRAPVTAGTAVAKVNGEEILYTTWATANQQRAQQVEQQQGRSLTLDERRRLDNETFDDLVQSILLSQEYKRRNIRVTDEEIVEAAQYSPPPALLQAAELQTDGRFDLEKYQRFLKSPAARQQGLLVQLENYYRTEIPRTKLFDQVSAEVYVTDNRLWQTYKDQHDSAQVTYVAMDVASIPDTKVTVSDADLRSYYDAHRKDYDRPGRAVLSLLVVPRTVSASDSASVRTRITALRDEIVKGAKFEDVAKRESSDTLSAREGGSLGKGGKGRFIKTFEDIAYALKPGELSPPVLTEFGYHIIKVDERKGDTISVRHILLRIQQSDSSATRTDRVADSLARIAASQELGAKFDSAAKVLKLVPLKALAFEGEPLSMNGKYVPSASAWAFGGAQPGETSDLFDADDAYYLARLDSISDGGVQSFDAVKDDVRRAVIADKKIESVMPQADAVAAGTGTLEQAAEARGLKTAQTPMFTRTGFAAGLGRLNEAVGAAFSLPIGKPSAPIRTDAGVFVIRVDKRTDASHEEFEKQKATQRTQVVNSLRQQRVRAFLEDLRKNANIDDRRKQINTQLTRQAS